MTPTAADPESPITIAIDARPLAGVTCGYTVHMLAFIERLRAAGFLITLLSNQEGGLDQAELRGLPRFIFGRRGDLGWEQSDLPRFLRSHHFDLYFSDANRGIPWSKRRGTRYILGLHDIIPYKFPRQYLLAERAYRLRNAMLRNEIIAQLIAIARADAILTVSRSSAHDIRTFFRKKNVHPVLIRLKDIDPPAFPETKDQFVYLGGIDVRKRIDILIRAFALFSARHPEHRLVLIGIQERYAQYLPLIESVGLTGRVVMTGYVDHDTKARLLGESRAVTYLSTYEGYGMAIAEGMQAGVPIIAGRGGSQAEVGGDAVRYVDPLDPAEVAQAMEEMLDPETRAAWIAKGRAQYATLSDEKIERAIVDFFQEQGRLARASQAAIRA